MANAREQTMDMTGLKGGMNSVASLEEPVDKTGAKAAGRIHDAHRL